MKHMSVKRSLVHLFHPRRSNNHRSKLLHPEYILGLFLTALIFFVGTYRLSVSDTSIGYILGYASDITIDKVVAGTNAERARSGLQPVAYSPVLSQAAQRKAANMFAEQYWAHTSPSGREPWDFMGEVQYRYRVAGENLARDFLDSSSMFDAWMASPTHRAIILNPRYIDIGIAVVNGTLLGTETTLVVQMFGDPVSVAEVQPAAQVGPPSSVASDTSTEIEQPAELPLDSVVEDNPPEVALEFSAPVAGTQQVGLQQVLSTIVVPGGDIARSPIISPNNMWKAFGIAVALLLISTLAYDGVVAHNKRLARIVGQNVAHIMLFLVVIFVLLFFKGGVIS